MSGIVVALVCPVCGQHFDAPYSVDRDGAAYPEGGQFVECPNGCPWTREQADRLTEQGAERAAYATRDVA